MGDRPYADQDLCSAAALMHYAMTTEPNPTDADSVLSGHPAWAHVEVGSDEEDTLRESVVELVSGAADVSQWAINLGADGLQPHARAINIGWNDGPLQARIHIAFPAAMPDGERDQFVTDIADAIAGTVPVR